MHMSGTQNIKMNLMDKKEMIKMVPYYRNYNGSVDLVSDKEFKITGNYNITSRDCCVSVSGSSAYTVTLPTAVGISGKVYVIKSNMSTGILLTVATTSSQTIDGVTTKSLARFDALKVISNGSNWEIF